MPTKAPLHRDRTRHTRFEHLESRLYLSAARATQAVNSFGVDLYAQLQNAEGNLFFSPLSVATALAMTYAGAAGETAAEMEHVLHLGAEPGIHESFADLLSSLGDETALADGFQLELANAIWPQTGFSIRDEFIHTIETDYDGAMQSLDYSDLEAARQIINAWVEDKTHGKVEELLKELHPGVVMVLTNSIYFQADWKIPFDSSFTFPGQFRRDNGEFVAVPIMAGRMELPAYTRLDGFKVLEIPLEGGRTSMVFALPEDPAATPNELTAELLVQIDDWLESPRDRWEMDVMLPRFSTAVGTQLEDLLADMGMPSAFGPGADFSKMTPSNVFITQVRHKAFFEMDEEGTEAAAATAVELGACFAAGTLVLTPKGEIPIEQLKAGDYVLSKDETNVEGKIEPKLVEATFLRHGELFNLHIGGQIIRPTKEHPFFVKGKEWTPTGELRAGDLLATDRGSWMELEKVVASGQAAPVYNFRVADHHTYFVSGKTWGFAVWTHNEYAPKFLATNAFHFIIRDNTTNAFLFMGRIDDPTQSENDLVNFDDIIAGDYDKNGDIDGQDLSVWKSQFGQAGPNLPADGDRDGDVDGHDNLIWQRNLGMVEQVARAVVAPALEGSVAGQEAASEPGDQFALAMAKPPAARPIDRGLVSLASRRDYFDGRSTLRMVSREGAMRDSPARRGTLSPPVARTANDASPWTVSNLAARAQAKLFSVDDYPGAADEVFADDEALDRALAILAP